MATFAMSQGAGKYKIGASKSEFPKLKQYDSVVWNQRWTTSAIKLVSDSSGSSKIFDNTSGIARNYEIFPSLGRYETYCVSGDTINSKLVVDYAYTSFVDGKLVGAILYINKDPYVQNMIDALHAKYGKSDQSENLFFWKAEGGYIQCYFNKYQTTNVVVVIKSSEYSKILKEYDSERNKIFDRMKSAEETRRNNQLLDGF